MSEAYIIDAVRTPVGRKGGGLSQIHPADLGAFAIRELLTRSGVDPMGIDDVVFGVLDALGPNAGDIARTASPCIPSSSFAPPLLHVFPAPPPNIPPPFHPHPRVARHEP